MNKKILMPTLGFVVVAALIILMQNCAKVENVPPVTAGTVADPNPACLTTDPVCADPSGAGGDEICISGRVVDGANHSQNVAANVTNNIEIRFYEVLNFLSDPTTPPFKKLTVANGQLDTCGRFTARISVSGDTPNGVIAITATDITGGGSNNYILGTATRRVVANTNITSARTFLVSKAQDQAWATAAGLGGTNTFASLGTVAVRYYQGGASSDAIPGTPIRGVVPYWNGASNAAIDFFFSDTASNKLQTIVVSQNETGSNGFTFLTVGTGLGNSTAGTSCLRADGTSGTLSVTGATLSGATIGAIVFRDLEATCF